MNDGNKATASAKGIGFCGLLGVAFIVLKLCKVIDWPWVWVLAPIWGSISLWIIVSVLVLAFIRWLTK